MRGEPAARGEWGTVEWAVDDSGKAAAREFFTDLEDPDAAKVQALFNLLANTGQIRNREKFKKLCDMHGQALWEFKSFQLRLLGAFTPGRRFLVAHGLRKKKRAHSRQDLERTARILNEHLALNNQT